ncbi:hypothetical protein E3P92_03554 [Wallemia ichthyophaga]|nr:hypothetical protein E3P98_03560 [Wallemia ichthyophaga]TIB09173.1 hypothetical protein E3P92_03554 [Wallemia ichthyophaga]
MTQALPHSRSPSPKTAKLQEPPAKKTKVEVIPLEEVDYANGLHLAPMVRSGALPTRLISLEYGAKLVWTPEVIDRAIIDSQRVYNTSTGVIDYIKPTENKPIWSTHPLERPHVIYQIGSSSPQLAVQAAQTVAGDVAGIDLNCGCPKHFSVHAGMGAALLTNTDNLVAILNALCEALPHKSISCKIRLLGTQQDTIELVERICSTPIKAITIHCRTKSMRPSEPAQHDRLAEVREAIEKMRPDVAVICNGDGNTHKDAQEIMSRTGVNAVMIARGAEGNPSCFNRGGPVKLGAYWLQLAHALDHLFPASKFCTGQLTPFAKYGDIKKKDRSNLNQALSQAKTHEQMAEAYKITLTQDKGLDQPMFDNYKKGFVVSPCKRHHETWLLGLIYSQDKANSREESMLSDTIPPSAAISNINSKVPSPKGGSADSADSAQISADEDKDELQDQDDDDEEELDEEYDSDGQVIKSIAPAPAHAPAKDNKRPARKSKHKVKKDEIEKSKNIDSVKRFSYLIGQTDLFKHFIDRRKERDPAFRAMIEQSEVQTGKKKAKKNQSRRKTEKEEDEELLQDEEDEPFAFTETPAFIQNCTMRDYQVQGLNWMIGLHHNGINGILADEMGLGKTLQTISFLAFLKHFKDISGYHLVCVPKSTLDNWAREFSKWCPDFKVVVLQGTKEEREKLVKEHILPGDFDVLISSYEICLREKSAIKRLSWEYIIIDEAHRIKNANSLLSQIVRIFNSRNRLLITGTPLQNNLMELWALLNFLLPDVFSSSEDFDAWFTNNQEGGNSDEVVKQLHKVLRPFLLRRVKADVEKSLLPKKEINLYVGLTDMQRKWYKGIIEKDIDLVNGMGSSKKEGKTRLLNIVMQLRKCCNHPYLFDGAEPGPPYTTDEHLVFNSGKMLILDKLLKSMKAKGSRVLIFSQMSRVLDILEDYCMFRDYQYCRIDGQTSHDDRISAIDEYNKEGSEKYIFLLTTRAGGLGITLNTADIVVLYDSDWNPQADLQAMDRAHRIGQKKQVFVFRFVTEDAVEERILERAAQKLRLDQLVIQQGRQTQQKNAGKDELTDMIQHGAEKIINNQKREIVDNDIDEIIKTGESKTANMASKYEDLNLEDLNNFKSEINFTGVNPKAKQPLWIEPGKRERKQNYSIDDYYKGAMKPNPQGRTRSNKPPPATHKFQDYHFFPTRLLELARRDDNYKKKEDGWEAIPRHVDPKKAEENPELVEQAKVDAKKEQDDIDSATPLSEEEIKDMEAMSHQGFTTWTRREFQAVVRGMEQHGRNDLKGIKGVVGDGKTEEEVKEYLDVWWKRYPELQDHQRMIQRIEEGEKTLESVATKTRAIKAKVNGCRYPLQMLNIPYGPQQRGKQYTEDEDRFLLVKLAHHGLSSDDTYDKIKRDILEHPAFRMDWFFKSRTPTEISRRCQTLISLTLKEAGLYEGKHAHPSAYPADHKEGELIANTNKKRTNLSLSPSSNSSKRAKATPPQIGPGMTPSVLAGPSPLPQGYSQAQASQASPQYDHPQAHSQAHPSLPPMSMPNVPFPDQPFPPPPEGK